LPLKVGSVYQFNVQGGTVISQLPGGQGWLIRWGRNGIGFINYRETDSNGCVGKWKNVSIQIAPRPFFKPIIGDTIVCEPNITNVSYSVQNPIATSTYQWFIDGGRINQGQGTPSIIVDWNGILTRKIGYVEINGFGCNGDTAWQSVYFDNLTLEINSISTQPSNPGIFELSWKVTSPLNLFKGQYQIYYRPLGSGVWNIYGGIPYTQTSTTLDRLLTDQIYDFKVEALNNCNRLSSTPPHRNVVVKGTPNGNTDLTLTWNTYQGWKDGVSAYELLKNKNEILLPDQSTYFGLDTTQRLEFLLDEYRVCYRVLSHENNGGNQSYSNRYCSDLEPIIHLPNAFTPDLNGLNDSFKAVGFAIKDFQMEIYNRWGERIYESNNLNEGWDGTFKGKEAIEGIYIYLVRYSSGKGKTYLLKGNLSLIR
jgi:gliding motility-associated-like protein